MQNQKHIFRQATRSAFFRRKVSGTEPSEPFIPRAASYLPEIAVIVAALVLTGFQKHMGV